MFCPKCGKKNNENKKFCGFCGFDFSSAKNIIEPETPRYEQPAIQPPVAPLRKDVTDTRVFGEKHAERKPRRFEKRKRSVGAVVTIVVLSVLIVAAVTGGIWYMMYENSPARKIEKTVGYILDNKLSKARDTLDSFEAENEGTIRAYLEVLDKRALFVTRFDPNVAVRIDSSSVIDARDDFFAALKSFRKNFDTEKLPEKLARQCEYYYEKFTEIDDLAENIIGDVNDSQKVFLNEVICNRNSTFTLSELQANVDASNKGISNLMKKLKSDDVPVDWRDESDDNVKIARRLIKDFSGAVKSEIEFCEEDIRKNLAEGKSEYAELYRKNPDADYYSVVCGDLENVVDEDDIETNTLIFRNTLICSFSASAISQFK